MTPIFSTEAVQFKNLITFPNIQIQPNIPTFVVGKNGSGKSTLFKMFNRTLSPAQGKILYRGEDIASIPPLDIRKQVLLVSQQVFLFDDTIRGNFATYYEVAGKEKPSDDEIEHYLSLTNANFGLDHDTRTLSGGERQRVYLAIYASFKPDVLLLDEPTAALDKESAVDVMAQIFNFCEENKISCVTISHDANIVSLFARQIVRLS
ncbi:MAG: energy-coupling factor ABC transporter ATP-binding protein [Eubacteriales bacterium]